ncbi:hypothetical protein Glove_542g6 [Diversispora epigaea]|uniref:Uncharacterized protein n=1 Tax=Diversispora epigaea TaxID=1348612 RepID=A0A397GE87_9GLOM|nr:hypothetical protein Glove_542g6 [Diversispora epigaea]
MSVNFKCLYCDRYLSSRNAYSQYVKYYNELKELNISTEESNNDISDTVSSINEMSLESDDFSQIEELQISEISYQYESDSNYAGDVSLRSEEFENFDEILSESLQNYTEKSDTNMSNTLEEFEPKSLTLQDNIEESEVKIKEFSNETYADLMTLVTKHNLSNKAENSIIKFFNRHSDLSQSPLPKNIETEENLPPVSEISYQYESDSNYADDVSLRSEEFENFDEILSESLQNYTEKSDTNMSNTLEEFEPKSLTLQDNIEESEVKIKEFSNETYADLMTLVTKHNLSNKAENSIIKFFNRHSDLSQSPLPKNIETDSQELKINVQYKFTSSEKLKTSTYTKNLMTKLIYCYTNNRLPNCDQHQTMLEDAKAPHLSKKRKKL